MITEMTLAIEQTFYPVLTLPHRPKALLDRTVAEIYGVLTKQVNQAVSRNSHLFPSDFYFELDRKEFKLVTNCDRFPKLKHSSVMPKAFTWEGCNMLATVLKSETAFKRSIQIIRAFTSMEKASNNAQIHTGDREILKALACEINEIHLQLRELEQLKERLTAIEKKLSEKKVILEAKKYEEESCSENNYPLSINLLISKFQAQELQKVVKAKASSKKEVLQIWFQFKKQFEVTRYQHLPKAKFKEALKWLKRL